MKVKLKREIVTMGVEDVDPTACVGRYATPSEWNALIDDPECLVIDTRNDYEVAIGSFQGAVNPGTQSFCDFPGGCRTSRPRAIPRWLCFAPEASVAKIDFLFGIQGFEESGICRVVF